MLTFLMLLSVVSLADQKQVDQVEKAIFGKVDERNVGRYSLEGGVLAIFDSNGNAHEGTEPCKLLLEVSHGDDAEVRLSIVSAKGTLQTFAVRVNEEADIDRFVTKAKKASSSKHGRIETKAYTMKTGSLVRFDATVDIKLGAPGAPSLGYSWMQSQEGKSQDLCYGL